MKTVAPPSSASMAFLVLLLVVTVGTIFGVTAGKRVVFVVPEAYLAVSCVTNDGDGICDVPVGDTCGACSDCNGVQANCSPGQTCCSGVCINESCASSSSSSSGPYCGDGNVDPGENCGNCPSDVVCSSGWWCNAGTCTSGGTCQIETICGDGYIMGAETCDDGGICTGSTRPDYKGRQCKDIVPGDPREGLQRCRATGGSCMPQGGDGCSADCAGVCLVHNELCFTNADCNEPDGAGCAVCSGGLCIFSSSSSSSSSSSL